MKQLDEHVNQFRVAQKRLLILFKDKTPTSLKNLDVLLDSSFKQVISCQLIVACVCVFKAEHLYSALHDIQTTLKCSGMDHTI